MGRGDEYQDAVHAARLAGVGAEPEAQLTVPIANLLTNVAADHSLSPLTLLREAQLDGVRPDFAALAGGRPCGWIELKAPGHPLDGEAWTGREKKQWGFLSELDSLIITDGKHARLYASGERVGDSDAPLPWDGEPWDAAPLVTMLQLFSSARPTPVRSVSDLASRLAPLTAMLRDRLISQLSDGTHSVVNARAAWTRDVHEGVTDEVFASNVAQVVAYSLAIAGISGEADLDEDGLVTLGEAREALRGPHAQLAASLGPVLGVSGFLDAIRVEVGAIERLVSAIDRKRISSTRDSRGEPWLYFYEDFLQRYDPEARKQAGVYYTPVPVVDAQVRLTEFILREIVGIPLGFADSKVVTLDPATGSGTYPLAVIDAASARAIEMRGVAGQKMAARNLGQNLIAFELLPGPYAVAHLRIGRRLAEVESAAIQDAHVRVYMTNTLDDPDAGVEVLPGLWGDSETLAAERARAARVRKEQRVTVIIGNPPYLRRSAGSGGSWVVHPAEGRSLFQDVLDAASERKVNVSGHSAAYNDYVYFWRWAIWKALEQNTQTPAVVSFITGSSWLAGPGLVGLRKLAREMGDEIWVIDLGGNGRTGGSEADENVFAIQTPVAIVTVFRARAPKRKKPATVFYRRISGTRTEKEAALDDVRPPRVEPDAWQQLPEAVDFGEPFIPGSTDADWLAMPLLTELFPWQQPGSKVGRAWPIAPDPDVLAERWARLVGEADLAERAKLFVTGSSGRNIHTRVGGMETLSSLSADSDPKALVRYGFRPFDRQWTFEDARLAKTESPSLWQARGPHQLFLVGRLTRNFGAGPALTVSTHVPDMHAFKGSDGGKDVLPLYRDAEGRQPNITVGLLDALTQRLGRTVTPETLAAYVFAVMAGPGYQRRFAEELKVIGSRVPVTAAPDLWDEAVALGEELLWLQTFGERFSNASRPSTISRHPDIEWVEPVGDIPATTADIRYDADTHTLHVGTGAITGVWPEVWDFEVTGFDVVRKWFGSRTAKGIGLASGKNATPLDLIRPAEWLDVWYDEALELLTVLTRTVELAQRQQALLVAILGAPLVDQSTLPKPTQAEGEVPETLTHTALDFDA